MLFSIMKKLLSKILDTFIYVFFPKICFSCNTPLNYYSDLPICENCKKQIKYLDTLVCQKCGLPLDSGGKYCYNCKKSNRRLYFSFTRGVVEYKEPIKTLIHEYKYQQKIFLKKFLSSIMIEWFKINYKIYPQIDIVCCVPMNFFKKFYRGYNQAELLAREFAKENNLIFYPKLLRRTKITVSQFKLPREKRLQNVKDAFKVNREYLDMIKGRNILIIDDVCTTTETINQCAKVLKKSGAKEVFGLTLARDI